MSKRCSAAVVAMWIAANLQSTAASNDADARMYARAPAFALPALSPDGAKLSYVEQSDQRQTVVVRTLSDGRVKPALNVESRRERVRWCDWATDEYLLCGTIAPVRAPDRITERTYLYSIEAATGRVRELNGRLSDPVRDHIIDFAASRPRHVLLQHDEIGKGYPQVSELEVSSGALNRIVNAQPPVRRWMSDGRGAVRLGIGYDDGAASLFVREEGGEWRVALEQPLNDIDTVGPVAFGSTAADLYVLKQHEGRTALFRMDLGRPTTATLLLAHDTYDVAGPVILHPQTRTLLAVRYVAEGERQKFFDADEAARTAWLDEQLPGAVNLVVDRSSDNRHQLVRSASDTDPPSVYLFDVQRQTLALIGHDYPELEVRPLAPMRSLTYRARDGQAIPAFLTLPKGGASNLPTVVLPHGGPESRTVQTFDPLVQFLAAQGYAVLQMNFRGSLGYGIGFASAGVGQWGGVIHNDITDGARWLVEQRIADPTRMCILGTSFGGYAALLGAARESEWYACAVSYAGLSDLIAFSQYTERLHGAELWQERLGESSHALWQMSPMSSIRSVEMPVLVMHGRNDPVVPVTQARRFARALRRAEKPHRFLERVDCDHDMTVESCRIAFFSEAQRFLATSIGLLRE